MLVAPLVHGGQIGVGRRLNHRTHSIPTGGASPLCSAREPDASSAPRAPCCSPSRSSSPGTTSIARPRSAIRIRPAGRRSTACAGSCSRAPPSCSSAPSSAQTRAVLIARTIVGLVVAALIVRRIIDPPALDYDVTPQLGVYLGALGALAAAAGGLIDSGREVVAAATRTSRSGAARRASCRAAPDDAGARTRRPAPRATPATSSTRPPARSGLRVAVALFDTGAPLRPLRPQIDAAIARVVDSGRFILGPEVDAFESELAAYCGCRHAIGVANGTEALTIALRAMGVGPGDDVVVPSFTFYASAEAIPPTGARPVFCDVDPLTGCVTAETVRAALTPATKAVVAVHLFGNVAPVAEIEALGVPVLEDAAQAAGSRSARRAAPARSARAATFSFFPSKNLGALRRRRRDHDRRRRDRRARAHAALPRLARQGHLRGRRLQLAPRRAAGGGPARAAAAPRRLGRRPPRRGGALRGGGPRRARDAAGPDARLRARVAPLRRAARARRRPRRRPRGRRRSSRAPTTARPCTASRRWRARQRRRRCPRPTSSPAPTSRSR